MRRTLTILALAVAAAPLAAQAPAAAPYDTARPRIAARPADVATLDSTLAVLYDVISGPAGQRRDWDRMRSLFAPGARLIPTGRAADGQGTLRTLDVEGYIASSGPRLESAGFYEREIARRSDRYGNVVHAFSTYESRRTPADARPFARGINSIQLWNDGRRWWVVTVYWEAERPDTPIPAAYLPPAR